MIWADGVADPREIDEGIAKGTAMLGDWIKEPELRSALSTEASSLTLDPAGLDQKQRLLLVRVACDIILADDEIHPDERVALDDLGEELGLEEGLALAILQAVAAPSEEEEEGMKAIAADVLGVAVDAPIPELQAAYERALVGLPEDAEQAEAMRDQIDSAYQTLAGVPA